MVRSPISLGDTRYSNISDGSFQRGKRLREEVRRLLKQAEATDEEEDQRYGRERQGDELLEELQRRETRIARIQEAKKVLEERERVKAESESKDRKERSPSRRPNTTLRIRSPAS